MDDLTQVFVLGSVYQTECVLNVFQHLTRTIFFFDLLQAGYGTIELRTFDHGQKGSEKNIYIQAVHNRLVNIETNTFRFAEIPPNLRPSSYRKPAFVVGKVHRFCCTCWRTAQTWSSILDRTTESDSVDCGDSPTPYLN